MTMDYAASIPSHMHEAFERMVVNYRSKERDKELARNLSTMRTVGPTVQTDTVTYWEKIGGNDVINAKITAKGVAPEMTGAKGTEVSHAMHQISVGFLLNERDLALDPAIQTRKLEIATRDIRRREDYNWINGVTSPSLTGLVTAARANPGGKVDAYAASSSSPNVDSIGNWAKTDTYMDIYKDVLMAVTRLGDEFDPAFMLGRKIDIAPIRDMDDMRNVYADQLLDLFGAGSTNDFIRTSAYVPAGYVYIIAKDMEFTEFVISEDLRVDTSYGKKEGGNFYVELKEWVNLNEFHDMKGAVEINTA